MSTKKAKISIFPPKSSKETVIGSNGISLDNICTSCISEEELSSTGNYVLDATFLLDEEGLYKIIERDCILKVRIDGEDEIFRIIKYDPGLRYINITALQITITEQKQLWLDDVRPTNTNGMEAINHMLSNAIGNKEIDVYSDISIISTAYYQLLNFYEACYDCDQSFLKRWGVNGLETKRRGYNLYLNKKRGNQSNLSIREGKNLTGFSGFTNMENLCTRGIGKGYNGIKGDYVESSKKNNYSRVNTKVFEYKVRVREEGQEEDSDYTYFNTEAEAKAELNRLVGLEFSENNVDELKAEYDINFVQLEKTQEYKKYAYLEKADVGDYVKVYVEKLDVDITLRVVNKKYNILAQKTESMSISNKVTETVLSTAQIVNDLKKQYENTGNNDFNAYLTAIINAGLKNSNVIVRKNEILIMDTTDINTAKNVWRWNAGALAHSSDGYYTTNWNIGITQNGEINADRILAGVLTAILIKSLDGKSWFNLSTGELVLGNGKIIVNNQSGEKVMWVDENGNLSVNTLKVFGNGSNTVNFSGAGSKAINFKSDDAKDLFINFWRGTDTNTRIGIYKAEEGGSDRSYQLFIEPGSTISDKEPMVIFRGANSTPEENEMCILEIYGDIVAIRDLYIGSNTSKINVREEIESLKARITILEGGA